MSGKILYLDTFSGISGDMFLAALADAGYEPAAFNKCIEALGLHDVSIRVQKVMKQVIQASQIVIESGEGRPPLRRLRDLKKILDGSRLPEAVRSRSLEVFEAIAAAEGAVHGMSPEDVHFHEIGAIDTIVDVCCTVNAIHEMNIQRIVCSPLPMGRGFIRGEHGILPLPAPATAELLKNAALRPSDIERELVTPTGAALVKVLASSFGPMPAMLLKESGWGAGTADLKIPNVLRIFIGEEGPGSADEESILDIEGVENDSVLLLECNLDDMSPEQAGFLMERLFEEGALDAWFTAIQMKKNRPAFALSVLCPEDRGAELAETVFRESSTAGLRTRRIERLLLQRRTRELQTVWGSIRVKDLYFRGKRLRSKPEYDDCARLAREHSLPLSQITEAAAQAASEAAGEE